MEQIELLDRHILQQINSWHTPFFGCVDVLDDTSMVLAAYGSHCLANFVAALW